MNATIVEVTLYQDYILDWLKNWWEKLYRKFEYLSTFFIFLNKSKMYLLNLFPYMYLYIVGLYVLPINHTGKKIEMYQWKIIRLSIYLSVSENPYIWPIKQVFIELMNTRHLWSNLQSCKIFFEKEFECTKCKATFKKYFQRFLMFFFCFQPLI